MNIIEEMVNQLVVRLSIVGKQDGGQEMASNSYHDVYKNELYHYPVNFNAKNIIIHKDDEFVEQPFILNLCYCSGKDGGQDGAHDGNSNDNYFRSFHINL